MKKLVFMLLCIWWSFPAFAQEQPIPVTIQLRWYHQFQFAGYCMAAEKGYYAAEGLAVAIEQRKPGTDPIKDVADGKVEFGVSNSEILLQRMQGVPLVALGAIFQHSPLIMVSRAETGIRTPHDFHGQRILLATNTKDVEILAMLRAENVRLSSMDLDDRFASPKDYLDPDIKALAAYSTNQPYIYERDTIPYTEIHPSSYGIDFYGDCLFTSERMLKLRPDVVEAFRKASLRGWEYAMRHPSEAVEVIITKYGSRKTRPHLLYEAQKMRELMLPDLVQIGHMNPGRWKHISDVFFTLGMTETQGVPEGFIYSPNTNGHMDETLLRWLGALGILFIVMLIGVGALATFNRRLQSEVNERKRAEEEVLEVRNSLNDIIESLPFALVRIDPDGFVLHWNKFARTKYELSSSEVTGRHFAFLLEGFSLDVRQILTALEQRSHVQFSRVAGADKDKRIVYDVSFVPLRSEEGGGGVLLLDDVSEQVRMEELVIQSEKMMSVGGLAAGLAHEINNPLGSVLQGAQNISRRLSDAIPANVEAAERLGCSLQSIRMYLEERKVLKMLDGIEEAGNRAAKIVQNMLSFSRKAVDYKKPVDICELITTTLELAGTDFNMKKHYDFKKITIVQECEESLPLVSCESVKVQQVLLNIFKNGAEAMAAKKYEADDKPCFILRAYREASGITVSIEDNGVGMPADVRSRIFEPFYTTKPVGQGTGLGLSIAYFIIVEEHKGQMFVESKPNEWTRFTLFFPDLA